MSRSKRRKAKTGAVPRPAPEHASTTEFAASEPRRHLRVGVTTAADQVAKAPDSGLPTVSICTVTQNRSHLLPLLENCILNQTYPRHLLEWVIVDDSDPGQQEFTPRPDTGLETRRANIDQKLILGRKRNLSHRFCQGEVIVYMDDDEYYPPRRVEHAVESLQSSGKEVAGASNLPILFIPERQLWIAGPYGANHATANTFAFRRSLLAKTHYQDEATHAEEKAFLNDYSFPMVQLDPKQTIVCFGHRHNTFDKRQLIAGGNNPKMQRVADAAIGDWIAADLLDRYVEAHGLPRAITDSGPAAGVTTRQATGKGTLFLICSPPGSGQELIFQALGKLGALLVTGPENRDECLSMHLLKPDSLEARSGPAEIQTILQEFNQQLIAHSRGGNKNPLVMRDPRASALLQEITKALDIRLIACLRPLAELIKSQSLQPQHQRTVDSSQAHRIYGQVFSIVTNSTIPYHLVRHHDLINNPEATIGGIASFCGLNPSQEQIFDATQLIATAKSVTPRTDPQPQ